MRRGVAVWAEEFFALDDDWARRPGRRARRNDTVIAVLFLAFTLVTLELVRSLGVIDEVPVPVPVVYLLVALGCLLIVVRRRWPLAVAVLGSLHFLAIGLTMPAVMGQLPSQALYFYLLFSAAAWARDRRQMLMVMAGVLVLMFGWLTWQFAVGSGVDQIIETLRSKSQPQGLFTPVVAGVVYSFLVNVLYFGGAVLGGQVAWRGARQRARLTEQAATIEQQTDELREHAVVEERLRIARELHDVVAHHVSVMGVQAAAARRVLSKNQQAAEGALAEVEESARQAVGEMRALLGTLRRDGRPSSSESRSPEPGVGDLPRLVEQVRSAQLDVSWSCVEDVDGAAAQVPAPIGLSLYRTVQEALANVRRHSTATRASVVLRVQAQPGPGAKRYAEVEVLDDGHPRGNTSGTGLGLLGMRERVTHLGGTSEIGPRITGGFRVRVRLPLDGTVTEAEPSRPVEAQHPAGVA
ncbi:MAG TPA: sensor histidine kinase [Segeticoccus sp.]|uniref:sensor histidine kinase n=1 Tax=Segeticoccus sp. TaxID=2706531 RepID=UPI002D7EB6AC|nr:sensor histidine kinase [Segeticoccus sp.]HET8601980.1 sensor histidine kinase [Segeticoccus sp.]